MNIEELGKYIKSVRVTAGMTQAELALATDLSKSTISDLERGKLQDLGVRKLASLLDFLNLEFAIYPRTRPTLPELTGKALKAIPPMSILSATKTKQRVRKVVAK